MALADLARGQIWTANLNPNRGREIGKIRPALIIQADALNAIDTPMVVILPLTTLVVPGLTQFRVTISARHRLRQDCQVVVDQPRALDRTRLQDGPLTMLTRTELQQVERGLLAVLGIQAWPW